MQAGPPKKKARMARNFAVEYSKTVLTLVLPFLFPGYYGVDQRLAFRTWLSLNQTCRQLRYWNFLRRWIAFTTPLRLRDRLRLHSFACPLRPIQISDASDTLRQYLWDKDLILDVPNPYFRSAWLRQTFVASPMENYEKTVGGNPFYNVIEAICDAEDPQYSRTHTCFCAPSFAELCLFVYSSCLDVPEERQDSGLYDAFLLQCLWKVPGGLGSFYYKKSDTASVMSRRMLGWLRRVGSFAPHEIGFHHGGMETNSYGLFLELSNTNGKRGSATPFARLEQFVHTWFPLKILAPNPVEPAYDFPFTFE